MSSVTLVNGVEFSAEIGTTILDAAQSCNVVLEHSCRTGRCGSCKAHVTQGTAIATREETALTEEDRAAGWILTCAYEARTDLALDIEDLSALADITVKTLPTRIESMQRLAPDVLRVILRLPPNAQFRFLAGQFIEVTNPGGVRRSYSIASDSTDPARLELHIRQVDGGQFSKYWFQKAQINDLLRFKGPYGTFYLRPAVGQHLIFLATGTGIAPILSMLYQLAAISSEDAPRSVRLYWGGRHRHDLYLTPSLPGGSCRYVPVLSRGDTEWSGARGHVQDVLLAEGADLVDTVVYACGSEAMIHAARHQLSAAGLPLRNFHFDAFVKSD